MSTNNQLSYTYSQASSLPKSEKYLGNRKKYIRFNWLDVFTVCISACSYCRRIQYYCRFSSTYSPASSPQKLEKIVGNKRKYSRSNWRFLL